MTLDDTIRTDESLPHAARAVNQLTSVQAVRAFIVYALTLTISCLILLERNIPAEIFGIYGLAVGSMFEIPERLSRPTGNR